MKRLVVATGTSQMLTAIAALKTRQVFSTHDCIFALVDLSVGLQEAEAFERTIRKLAHAFGLQHLHIQSRQTPQAIWDQLAQEKIGEVWSITNWQDGNRQAFKLFPQAKKICYGDGIGLYISETYFHPHAAWRRALTRIANMIRGKSKEPVQPFDEWILAIRHGFGLTVPASAYQLDKAIYQSVLKEATSAFELGTYQAAQGLVFMGCNFFESGRMTEVDEIEAYVDFFQGQGLCHHPLFIKPHPRDSIRKLQKLATRMRDIFPQVSFLESDELAYIPFEVILSHWHVQGKSPAAIAGFSSAVLGPKWFFGDSVRLGFGEDIVRKRFLPKFKAKRLGQECDLQKVLQELA